MFRLYAESERGQATSTVNSIIVHKHEKNKLDKHQTMSGAAVKWRALVVTKTSTVHFLKFVNGIFERLGVISENSELKTEYLPEERVESVSRMNKQTVINSQKERMGGGKQTTPPPHTIPPTPRPLVIHFVFSSVILWAATHLKKILLFVDIVTVKSI